MHYRAEDIGVTRDTNMAVAASAFVALIQVLFNISILIMSINDNNVVSCGGFLCSRFPIDLIRLLPKVDSQKCCSGTVAGWLL